MPRIPRKHFTLHCSHTARSVKLCFPSGKVSPDYTQVMISRTDNDDIKFELAEPGTVARAGELSFKIILRDPAHSAEATITRALYASEIDQLKAGANQITVHQLGFIFFKVVSFSPPRPSIPGLRTPSPIKPSPAPAPTTAPTPPAPAPDSARATPVRGPDSQPCDLSVTEAAKALNQALSRDPRLLARVPPDGRSVQVLQRIDW